MNNFAYQTTGYAIKALSNLSKARVRIHGENNIPKGAVVYAVNHFTRMETLFIPYHINRLTKQPIWSLADYGLFEGGLGNLLGKLGALSTKNPDRDLLIVKSLLTGEAAWVIFPEGRMVKNKKIYEKDRKGQGAFVISSPDGKHPPHTGTATLALRTEFYRERLRQMLDTNPAEANRLIDLYQIDQIDPVLDLETYIVPVNLTYYPIRAGENIMVRLAGRLIEDLSERMVEEIMTEGTMLFSGVDVDLRFGEPIRIGQYMKSKVIQEDIADTRPINFNDDISSKKMLRASALKIMERYMSKIYSMTTINHDHIFATLLKYMPVDKIDAQDLKRRAYLSTTLNLGNTTLNRHEALHGNQINLLTDDRYGRYGNFMSLAIEKGILIEKEQRLSKNPGFSENPDFHRIRIDNPFAVIANEAEPLTEFQDQVCALAKQPLPRIRYQIVRHLMKKAMFDFERDYTKFATTEESKEKSVGRPFFIKGSTRDTGIVLIHGYMAAPLEVRALADFLGEKGYCVYAPRLKGHGTSPEDLAIRTHLEWIESVEEGFAIMRNTCKRIVAGGFSTGAGLALDLCTRVPDVAGVFAISPPLALHDFSAKFVPAVNMWNKLMGRINFEAAKKEFVDNDPENPHINYKRNPISGLMELERLMNSVEERIPAIDVPALVIQSVADPVVDAKGSRRIFDLVSSKDKEYLLVNFERHGIINGDNSPRIFKAVADFMARLDAAER